MMKSSSMLRQPLFSLIVLLIAIVLQQQHHVVQSFSSSTGIRRIKPTNQAHTRLLSSTVITSSTDDDSTRTLSRKELIKKEGGRFAIATKFGGINLFALYYGFVAIALAIPWYIALNVYEFLQYITRYRLFDKNRFIPVLMNHLWGVTLMRLTRCYPIMKNRDILKNFYREGRCAMFVANHNSWMDIPFLGATIGWRNYKIIAKKELEKVPILGTAITVSGNLSVDRRDKKSGLKTLKRGIQYLKEDHVHLCTFPEGTRSKTGRLMPFKNGAFKMAHKAGAPVIPITIVGADLINPPHWIFPYRSAASANCHVIVHEPIESAHITENELAEQVHRAMVQGLPERYHPIEKQKNTPSPSTTTLTTEVIVTAATEAMSSTTETTTAKIEPTPPPMVEEVKEEEKYDDTAVSSQTSLLATATSIGHHIVPISKTRN